MQKSPCWNFTCSMVNFLCLHCLKINTWCWVETFAGFGSISSRVWCIFWCEFWRELSCKAAARKIAEVLGWKLQLFVSFFCRYFLRPWLINPDFLFELCDKGVIFDGLNDWKWYLCGIWCLLVMLWVGECRTLWWYETRNAEIFFRMHALHEEIIAKIANQSLGF